MFNPFKWKAESRFLVLNNKLNTKFEKLRAEEIIAEKENNSARLKEIRHKMERNHRQYYRVERLQQRTIGIHV